MKAAHVLLAIAIIIALAPATLAAKGNMTTETFATLASPTMEQFMDIAAPSATDLNHLKTANIADWYRYMNTKADLSAAMERGAAEQHLGVLTTPLNKDDYALANKYCQQVSGLAACSFDNAKTLQVNGKNEFIIDGKKLDTTTLKGSTLLTEADGSLIIKTIKDDTKIDIKMGQTSLAFVANRNSVITITNHQIYTLGTVSVSQNTNGLIDNFATKDPLGQTGIRFDEKMRPDLVETTSECRMDGTLLGEGQKNFLTVKNGDISIGYLDEKTHTITGTNGKARLTMENGKELQLIGNFRAYYTDNALTKFKTVGMESAAIFPTDAGMTTVRASNPGNTEILVTTRQADYDQEPDAALIDKNGALKTKGDVRFTTDMTEGKIDSKGDAPRTLDGQGNLQIDATKGYADTVVETLKEGAKIFIDANRLLFGSTETPKDELLGPATGKQVNVQVKTEKGTVNAAIPQDGGVEFDNDVKAVVVDIPDPAAPDASIAKSIDTAGGEKAEPKDDTVTPPEFIGPQAPSQDKSDEKQAIQTAGSTPPPTTPATQPSPVITLPPSPSSIEPAELDLMVDEVKQAYVESTVTIGSGQDANEERIVGVDINKDVGKKLLDLGKENADKAIKDDDARINELKRELATTNDKSNKKDLEKKIEELEKDRTEFQNGKINLAILAGFSNGKTAEQRPKLAISQARLIKGATPDQDLVEVSGIVQVPRPGALYTRPIPPMKLSVKQFKDLKAIIVPEKLFATSPKPGRR
jgi:hypothetical protein